MNITPINTTNQNKPAFGMKLKFETTEARELFQRLIPLDEYKKVLPEIEALKDKKGKEIIIKVANNGSDEDCLCLGHAITHGYEYLDKSHIDTDNTPSIMLMSKLKNIAEAVNDALTKKEYTKLLSDSPSKKPKA